MKVKNVYPYGAAYVVIPEPFVVLEFAEGETKTVTKEQALVLLAQPQNFEPADKAAQALVDKEN